MDAEQGFFGGLSTRGACSQVLECIYWLKDISSLPLNRSPQMVQREITFSRKTRDALMSISLLGFRIRDSIVLPSN